MNILLCIFILVKELYHWKLELFGDMKFFLLTCFESVTKS